MSPGQFEWLVGAGSSADVQSRVPLSIYVLWHPEFEDGPALARSVAEWWNGGGGDARALGAGIPVHFRSADWTEDLNLLGDPSPPRTEPASEPGAARIARLGTWRRPVRLDESDVNIFVPLVDDHMVADVSWRRDLVELARHHDATQQRDDRTRSGAADDATPRVYLATIQMTAAWARMPEVITSVKALYLDVWRDDKHEHVHRRVERRAERLRRQLTQAIVGLLRDQGGTKPGTELMTQVFLSHAKADGEFGPGVAERLRDAGAGYGQINVFYDENDLPIGQDWRAKMLTAAALGVGFVAVLSDRYATRYWCRLEIQQARTPTESGDGVWTVRPTVAVVTFAGAWTRLVGELATVPVVAWNDGGPGRASEIFDRLFREALVSEFHRRYAAKLARWAAQAGHGPAAMVTWTPDAASLAHLQRELRRPRPDQPDSQRPPPAVVAYPGHGFLPTEERDLDGLLDPGIDLLSYEALRDRLSQGAPPAQAEVVSRYPVLALSVGDAENLAALGYDAAKAGGSAGGSLHVDVAVIRLARAILECPARIAYGGVLRDSANFVSLLHDTVAAMPPRARPDGQRLSAAEVADPETPLINWVIRSRLKDYPASVRAELTGLCRLMVVGADVADDLGKALETVRALSVMRAQLAASTDATVVLAGKRTGFPGVLPGLAEEVGVTVTSDDPGDVTVVVLGEFGGVARDLVRYVLDPDLGLPPSLQLATHTAHPEANLAVLLNARPDLREHVVQAYARAAVALDRLRTVAGRDGATLLPRLGIDVETWRALMRTSGIGFAVRTLRTRILPCLRDRGAARGPRAPLFSITPPG
ncbi:MAG: TIR domain-containing protein [Kofleriaceae bacterium]|nr:TIR domain-containing protein [Kofleriaceae bacterium]MBP9168192.1 TIR domain-containing protein [Kofleriaceae bacterium]MBP9856430.1 TIR domain-containing protein [Kofleriaceae bacterium]